MTLEMACGTRPFLDCRRIASVCVLIALALSIPGCGGKPPGVKLPPTTPFGGTVTLDGKPLEGAGVTFMPLSKNEYLAVGKTDASGKYELLTVASESVKGAVPGDYKVRISLMQTPDGKPYDPIKSGAIGKESLKLAYSDNSRTMLTASIPKDGGKKDFDLKSK